MKAQKIPGHLSEAAQRPVESTAMSRVPLVKMESFDGSRDVEAALGGRIPAELPSPPRACLRGARPPSSSTPAPGHPLPALWCTLAGLRAGRAFLAPCFTASSFPQPGQALWHLFSRLIIIAAEIRGVETAVENPKFHSCLFCYPLDQQAPKFLMGYIVQRGFLINSVI